MLPGYVVYLAVVLGLVSIVPYTIDTLRGRTFPHRVTWCLWSLIPLVTFVVQVHADVGVQRLTTLAYVVAPAIVVGASFVARQGSWAITRFDWICAFISLVALAVFVVTERGNLTIVLLLIADACAAVPTLRKSFTSPSSETWTAFLGGVVSSVLTLATITRWTLATYAFPAYVTLQNLTEVGLIVGRIGPRIRSRRAGSEPVRSAA